MTNIYRCVCASQPPLYTSYWNVLLWSNCSVFNNECQQCLCFASSQLSERGAYAACAVENEKKTCGWSFRLYGVLRCVDACTHTRIHVTCVGVWVHEPSSCVLCVCFVCALCALCVCALCVCVLCVCALCVCFVCVLCVCFVCALCVLCVCVLCVCVLCVCVCFVCVRACVLTDPTNHHRASLEGSEEREEDAEKTATPNPNRRPGSSTRLHTVHTTYFTGFLFNTTPIIPCIHFVLTLGCRYSTRIWTTGNHVVRRTATTTQQPHPPHHTPTHRGGHSRSALVLLRRETHTT